LPRNNNNHRTKSFDEMLPPAAAASDQNNQDGYSQFASQAAAAAAAASTINGSSNTPTLFAQQWGYPPSPHLDYSTPQQHHQLSMPQMLGGQNYSAAGSQQHNNRGPHMHKYQPASPYYHTATTPGPPIQTTACNKGPDGANLFIFHIPNHFTNLDMYHLFCKYGTLLSVRIMVEKDTGRSRGFGFVSYDSPESAALAIKELNGFVIGNKRLKVQHKQIRATDHSTPSHHQSSSYPPDARDNSNRYNAPQSSNQNDDKDKHDSTNTKNIEGTGAATEEGLDENSKRQVNALPTGRKDQRGGGGSSGGASSGSTGEGGLSQLNVLRDALPELPK
jgi:CUG-BP- and ETR3-like factor